MVFNFLDRSTAREEAALQKDEIGGKFGKAYRIGLILAAIVGLGIGALLIFCLKAVAVGVMFAVVGIAAALLLPTVLSYRLVVDEEGLKEEYLIVIVRVVKEVKWSNIAFYRMEADEYMISNKITFYNAEKEKLMSFDRAIVGFGKLEKLAGKRNIKRMKSK